MGTEFIIYRLCGTVMIEDEKNDPGTTGRN